VSRSPKIPATLAELTRSLTGPLRRDDLLIAHDQGQWVPRSSEEVFLSVQRIAAALARTGVEPGDRVGLLSWNRPEWTLVDLAATSTGVVTVPVYPNLPYNEVSEILRRSGARAVFVSDADQHAKIERARDALPGLEATVVFDPWGLPEGTPDLARFEREGEERLREAPGLWEERAAAVSPDSLATLIYTSGTTGEPKGVMLSHGNICANVEAALEVVDISSRDLALSFLPLAHVFERLVFYVYLTCGAAVAYARSIERLGEDLLEVHPTIMATVPRLLEKIRERALEGVRRLPQPLRSAARWSVRVGLEAGDRRREGEPPDPWLRLRTRIADALVLRRLREHLGGRMGLVISGGAALAPEVGRFFWGAGIPVAEGYGLTETSPVIALNPPGRARLGSVGRPLPNVEVRIAEDGEILTRSPSVMQGYWEAPEATAEAIREGWFHTGDLGHLGEDDYLVVTGRKKEILVTSGGKNVAPVKVETLLQESPLIARAVVLGDGRPFLVALLVPEPEPLERLAREEGLAGLEGRDLLEDRRLRRFFRKELDRLQAGLAPFETVRRYHLLERDLTIDEGLLTPTLKVRRPLVEAAFESEIEALYR
jgi:long-chain acyl-CoA synthetase